MKAIAAYEAQKVRYMIWLEKHQLSHLNPIQQDDVALEKLLQLCLTKENTHNLALHSIWFLEKYTTAHKQDLQYIFDFLVAHLDYITIEGAQRILGNILLYALKSKSLCSATPAQEEQLISYAFDWLTIPGKSIAVVANSFDLLYTLSLTHDWIKEALSAEISLILERGTTPAIRSRGKKVLQQLYRAAPKK